MREENWGFREIITNEGGGAHQNVLITCSMNGLLDGLVQGASGETKSSLKPQHSSADTQGRYAPKARLQHCCERGLVGIEFQ